MIGYNSRETVQDATYDVQTQELNNPERSIETHVYRNGKIVATVRFDAPEDAGPDSLEEKMSQQHEEVCGKVREGTYELVFLWISRGIIAFESQDHFQALECFESVLAMEETHAEANAYLDKIQASLKQDAHGRRRVLEGYEKQIEALESSGRIMEASRKRAILNRICKAPQSSDQGPAVKKRAAEDRPAHVVRLKNSLSGLWVDLLPRLKQGMLPYIREELFPKIKQGIPSGISAEWLGRFKESLLPKIRDTLLPKIRENLFSKYVLVTFSTLLLTVLSGLIAADFQVKLDPAYHASLGKEYLEGNRISQARNLFYGVLRQNPESGEALDGFWQTFRKEGDFQKAGEMLEALLEADDSHPQLRFRLAEARRLSSRYAEAIPHYEEAVRRGFAEVPCKIGIGLCLVEQQNVAGAIDLWEDLIQRGSDDYRVDYCLGTAYQASGRLGRASVHYSRALQKRPESSRIYRALGDCLYGLHQQEKAEGLWKKAASLEAAAGAAERCPGPQGSAEDSTQGSLGRCFPFPLI